VRAHGKWQNASSSFWLGMKRGGGLVFELWLEMRVVQEEKKNVRLASFK
jgi:hypothetical protein